MHLSLQIKPFSFSLIRPLKTLRGSLRKKKGWLVKVQDNYGKCGWGEVSPINPSEIGICEEILKGFGTSPLRATLEQTILSAPGALGFGIGSALAELDHLIGTENKNGWLKAPKSALLLPTDESLLPKLETIVETLNNDDPKLTVKWKVCRAPDYIERNLLHQILKRLPIKSSLRLDANSGWDRKQANDWANYLLDDQRLEWLEQPLPTADFEGLLDLSKKVPVALDESLNENPSLREQWAGWQIRRPALEGDPRIILEELINGKNHIVISTSFETGIGRRWINHLSALQNKSDTPTAPGLAPGWCPEDLLFSNNPKMVWDAA